MRQNQQNPTMKNRRECCGEVPQGNYAFVLVQWSCGLDSGNKVNFNRIYPEISFVNKSTLNGGHFLGHNIVELRAVGLGEDLGGGVFKA